ncbi:MAG: Cof-type HAD-IIB family hydrolase [Chromatiaceae bacterium]|nr:MAG: Cof-type HAD-IIB family hydrolase [Chromatiaceae bacterium]
MYHVVVCDLDGTLLDPAHRVGEYTRAVLARLRASGAALVLASGRHVLDMGPLAAPLGGADYLISCNGAAVYDRAARAVQQRPLPAAVLGLLLGAARHASVMNPAQNPVQTHVYLDDAWLVEAPQPHLLCRYQASGFGYRVAGVGALGQALGDRPVLKVYYYGEHHALVTLEAWLLAQAAGAIATTFSLPQTLEVMAAGVDKGSALRQVLAALGRDPAVALCFGDGLNDREMLAMAGRGLLMANADPCLQADLPHLEMIGSNREEAVARFLDDLLRAGRIGA